MNLTIHRGTHEIGGSCVEVANGNDRILLDIGTPLADDDKKKKLPDIKGIYKNDNSPLGIDGMLISHPHMDHYGFFEYLRDDIPYYVGDAAKKLIDLTVTFTPQKGHIEKYTSLENRKSFRIKSFTITPYLMDHSAFDAYAFLVEADGKKLFYSGDFRAHGRKGKLFYEFIRNGPENIDALLLEGTMFGRSQEKVKSETELEEEILDIAKSSKNIILVNLSSQNIDRLVSFFRVARRSGRLFVIDYYTANILDAIKDYARIPYPNKERFKDVLVYFPTSFPQRIPEEYKPQLMLRFGKYKIKKEEISGNRHKIIMMVRPSAIRFLKGISGIEGGTFIYSLWEGYLEDDYTKKLIDFVESKNMNCLKIHTSGHADIPTLKQMAGKLNPKTLIPMHTQFPESYKEVFKNVMTLKDGEKYEI